MKSNGFSTSYPHTSPARERPPAILKKALLVCINFDKLFNKSINLFPKGGCELFMPAVKIRDNEPFERAFKRFTKQCEKAGLMSDIKKHQHYEKPSEKKKRKLAAAKRKQRKLNFILGS
jgi:small subunit ribosomal protein S21